MTQTKLRKPLRWRRPRRDERRPRSAPDAAREPPPDQELQRRLAEIRTHVRDSFGKVVMAMDGVAAVPEPDARRPAAPRAGAVVRDRVALAYPGADAGGTTGNVAGVAIWASVSEAVDGSIREQIRAGVFPVR